MGNQLSCAEMACLYDTKTLMAAAATTTVAAASSIGRSSRNAGSIESIRYLYHYRPTKSSTAKFDSDGESYDEDEGSFLSNQPRYFENSDGGAYGYDDRRTTSGDLVDPRGFVSAAAVAPFSTRYDYFDESVGPIRSLQSTEELSTGVAVAEVDPADGRPAKRGKLESRCTSASRMASSGCIREEAWR